MIHRSANELDPGFERDVYNIIRRIERRIVKSDYETAAIPFDPTPRLPTLVNLSLCFGAQRLAE